LLEFEQQFATEEACMDYLFKLREESYSSVRLNRLWPSGRWVTPFVGNPWSHKPTARRRGLKYIVLILNIDVSRALALPGVRALGPSRN
jgi:hypothetical protein